MCIRDRFRHPIVAAHKCTHTSHFEIQSVWSVITYAKPNARVNLFQAHFFFKKYIIIFIQPVILKKKLDILLVCKFSFFIKNRWCLANIRIATCNRSLDQKTNISSLTISFAAKLDENGDCWQNWAIFSAALVWYFLWRVTYSAHGKWRAARETSSWFYGAANRQSDQMRLFIAKFWLFMGSNFLVIINLFWSFLIF